MIPFRLPMPCPGSYLLFALMVDMFMICPEFVEDALVVVLFTTQLPSIEFNVPSPLFTMLPKAVKDGELDGASLEGAVPRVVSTARMAFDWPRIWETASLMAMCDCSCGLNVSS